MLGSFAGCHDARHAYLQSHDALWLRADTAACPEHQQSVNTGGTAKTTAAATSTAGQRRYNTHCRHLLSYQSHYMNSFWVPSVYANLTIDKLQNNVSIYYPSGRYGCLCWTSCFSLFSRPPEYIRADSSAFSFPNSSRLNHHSTAFEHTTTSLQHSADPHDPNHTGHTSLRELWNSTTATVCFIFNENNCKCSILSQFLYASLLEIILLTVTVLVKTFGWYSNRSFK